MSAGARVGRGYLALFASLYAIQGVVVAYFFNYNQLYMESAGVGREQAAGVQSLALVPFILKFLAGPVSDRVDLLGFGHRKPYIILGLGLQTLGLAGLSLLDPGRQLRAFGLVALATVSGMALYDTCCDGMVMDVTPPEDRPRVQGTLVASRFLAAMVCSLWFGYWLQGAGAGAMAGATVGPGRFRSVIWACAGLGAIPLLQAVFVPESKSGTAAREFPWAAFEVMLLPRSLVVLGFGMVYSTIGYGVEINLSPYYKSIGFDEAQVGMFASSRYLGRALGAAAMPLSMRLLGRSSTLAIGVVGLATATAAQAAIGGRTAAAAAAAAFAFGAANGWDDAVFFLLAMESSDRRLAASTYALFMAATNVSIAGGWLVAKLATSLGSRFAPAFLLSSLGALAALAFIPVLRRPAMKPEPVDGDS